ncbi:MAG: hypothetical protein KF805_11220 [Phycisphaeraceae bacterium]|nr:hypothetical protein [Phycisphaeraceae bacterium]
MPTFTSKPRTIDWPLVLILLSSGEHLLHGIDLHALGYHCERHVGSSMAVAHVFLRKQP